MIETKSNMRISSQELVDRFGEDAVITANDGSCAIRGHWLYVCKCHTPDYEIERDDGSSVILEIPEKSKDWKPLGNDTWFAVLGKGHRVGKKRLPEEGWSKAECRRFGVPRHSVDAYEVGDVLLCSNITYPEKLQRHSPFSDREFFIDESVPVCKVEE